jgi:hypothetical protein
MKLVETHRARQEIRGYGAPKIGGQDSVSEQDRAQDQVSSQLLGRCPCLTLLLLNPSFAYGSRPLLV